ncbi:Rieske (2Fe-2S) protein [Maritimibacter sp. 55A14]|uniref:aromatic ring-hydroxylating oxygenase subunit alpha n=1 Tax=Maritimibacter sp. 55A14 TaxID=2174844 RepID=UPI000D608E59|nr:aromatic ring-hydroxylating dioxygenase subunit alpha [Maritimibacter sp. 55A14]PWE34074.1 Rieske (2Fe-2S) protein [Maritimibacter sp. 55A14]
MMREADALSLLMTERTGYSLSRACYTDSGLFRIEMERIFGREWLFAAPACEIAGAGDFVTLQIGDWGVIVVRGADGAIRAFHNSCRHRGSRLCSVRRGSNPKLVCPYHQWTYELDGRLLWARDMGPDFDPARHGLHPVHCREAGGLVFICLADTPPAFDAFGEQVARYLAPHRLADARIAHESTIVENGNWKLVIENNRECYHCAGSHPSLCRTYSDDPLITGSGGEMPAAVSEHWVRCEAAGLPSTFVLGPDAGWRLARMPLMGRAESFTMDGQVAVKRPLGEVPIRDAGTLLLFHYPNTWNHFLSDHAVVFRVTPLTPTTTEVTTKWLVHKDAVEGVDYDLKRLTEVWTHTNDEDRRVVEENQIGINSPAYVPGPYSAVQEAGVMQFLDWYRETMLRGLTGRGLVAAE